jgi:BclA C-terminal domain/Collagen triple helix repeat (20 copies)
MRRIAPRRPSPAMVVAVIALSVALGGTGYAASTLVVSSHPRAAASSAREAGDDSGLPGARGPRGLTGKRGQRGANGVAGAVGAVGTAGTVGPAGAAGPAGPAGAQGPKGDPGTTGPAGAPGPTGPSGTSQYAEFYALMPADNAATVGVGTAVQFPQAGPQNGSITSLSASTFQLAAVGTYRVSFGVSVSEAGQLELRLNGTAVPYTVVGRATGTSQIVGESLVTTTTPNTVLEVINPAGNSNALTITPSAGGGQAVSASLVVQELG